MVATGAAALKSVMEEPPGLVLLDLNLPFIDGLEVCRLLRGRTASASDPHHHGDGADRRNGPRRRTRVGRGRLRHQAIQPAGARRARARRPAAAAADRGGPEPSATSAGRSRSISMPCRFASPGRQSGSPSASSSCCASSSRTATACSRATGCSSASGGSTARSKRDRSTCTWAGCAASSVHAGRQIETVIGMGYRFVEEPNALEDLESVRSSIYQLYSAVHGDAAWTDLSRSICSTSPRRLTCLPRHRSSAAAFARSSHPSPRRPPTSDISSRRCCSTAPASTSRRSTGFASASRCSTTASSRCG